jgi:hypothetical protein
MVVQLEQRTVAMLGLQRAVEWAKALVLRWEVK